MRPNSTIQLWSQQEFCINHVWQSSNSIMVHSLLLEISAESSFLHQCTFKNRASVESTRAQTPKHFIGHYWRRWHEKIELDTLVSPLTSRLISHHIPVPPAHSWAYLIALNDALIFFLLISLYPTAICILSWTNERVTIIHKYLSKSKTYSSILILDISSCLEKWIYRLQWHLEAIEYEFDVSKLAFWGCLTMTMHRYFATLASSYSVLIYCVTIQKGHRPLRNSYVVRCEPWGEWTYQCVQFNFLMPSPSIMSYEVFVNV